ncbi:MAG: hypothetical protein GY797_26340 [Deltaproteobacteria bacterium]|nr:hypothetical protein [Deltaproteobacteria bacterium]
MSKKTFHTFWNIAKNLLIRLSKVVIICIFIYFVGSSLLNVQRYIKLKPPSDAYVFHYEEQSIATYQWGEVFYVWRASGSVHDVRLEGIIQSFNQQFAKQGWENTEGKCGLIEDEILGRYTEKKDFYLYYKPRERKWGEPGPEACLLLSHTHTKQWDFILFTKNPSFLTGFLWY